MTGAKKQGRKPRAADKTRSSLQIYLTLTHFNEAILGARQPIEIFERVCDVAVRDGLFKFAWVGMLEGSAGEIRPIAKAGIPNDLDLKSLLSSMASSGHSAVSVQTGKPVIWNDVFKDEGSKSMGESIKLVGVNSIAAFPISKEGRLFAALILGSEKANAFRKEMISLIEGVIANISHSIDKYESERKRMSAEFDLKELNAELEKRIKQSESATIRAQTYLDFMSHDLTNILTPIMTYAEMIFSDERVPIDDRKYGKVIVDHVLRAAKFITRVKNLAIAETMPMNKIEIADLREAFLLAQSEVLKRYPNKDVEIEYGYPGDEPILVHGGNLIESVIEEVFDNAIRYSVGPRVELSVLVSQVNSQSDHRVWRIEIADNGPGIYPQLRDALLAEASAEGKGLSRVIASGIPFMSSIIRDLGGKLTITDRVAGDHSRGTKIIITIPVYNP